MHLHSTQTVLRMVVVGLSLSLGGRAWCCPTVLNLLPTADIASPGHASLQLESDGWPTPAASGSALYLLTEIGVRDDLEVGLDLADFHRRTHWLANGKWRFATETERRPEMAVGVYNAGDRDFDDAWFVVASKSLPKAPVQVTAGVLRDDCQRVMLGASYDLSDTVTLQTDWASGGGAFATLGVLWAAGSHCCLLPYYARNNTRSGDDFIGLNMSWDVVWRGAKGEE